MSLIQVQFYETKWRRRWVGASPPLLSKSNLYHYSHAIANLSVFFIPESYFCSYESMVRPCAPRGYSARLRSVWVYLRRNSSFNIWWNGGVREILKWGLNFDHTLMCYCLLFFTKKKKRHKNDLRLFLFNICVLVFTFYSEFIWPW